MGIAKRVNQLDHGGTALAVREHLHDQEDNFIARGERWGSRNLGGWYAGGWVRHE